MNKDIAKMAKVVAALSKKTNMDVSVTATNIGTEITVSVTFSPQEEKSTKVGF